MANPDFLRVGGKDVEGTVLPAGPILVAAQLPDGNPIKPVALDYVKRYEAANGPNTVATFGAHAADAAILLETAIPVALKTAKPGTPEFRAALRDALEGEKKRRARPRHRHHDADRPQRLRWPRQGDGHHQGWRLEAYPLIPSRV